MRIIAGSRKGLRLVSTKTRSLRPTTDRTKETMFNVIAGYVTGSDVLDIYAGTGSLGIEALSRGAAKAIFIENNRQIREVLARNLDASGFANLSEVIGTPAENALKWLGNQARKFDLIFADPPYRQNLSLATVKSVNANQLLARGGWLIVEHGSETELVSTDKYELKISKRQGDSTISFYHYGD